MLENITSSKAVSSSQLWNAVVTREKRFYQLLMGGEKIEKKMEPVETVKSTGDLGG